MKKGYRVFSWGRGNIVALKHDACGMILGSAPSLNGAEIKLCIKHHNCPENPKNPVRYVSNGTRDDHGPILDN